jgi:hypothetical protein
VKLILEEFFRLTDDGWVNTRADREIQHYRGKTEQASRAGRASAERRFNARSTDVQPTNNQEPLPITNNQLIKDADASLAETKFPPCPQQALIDLWKKKLPHLPQPRVWEGARQGHMRARWVQAAKPSSFSKEGYKTVKEGLAWWESFFAYIADDTSLSAGYESEGRRWVPDLVWVVNQANFQKIIDGKYQK